MHTIYPIRPAAADKRLFKQAARSAGLSLAEFLRRAAREKAKPGKRKAACLDYLDIEVDPEAEASPKEFIRKQARAQTMNAIADTGFIVAIWFVELPPAAAGRGNGSARPPCRS